MGETDHSIVVGSLGSTDFYQVPLALQKGGLLREFVTDFFVPRDSWQKRVLERVGRLPETRREDQLDPALVRSNPALTLLQRAIVRLTPQHNVAFARGDRVAGRYFAHRIAKLRGHALAYETFAWEAFTRRYRHQPVRILFQYHTHLATQRRLFQEEAARYPQFSFDARFAAPSPSIMEAESHATECWRHADFAVVSCHATRRSLAAAGYAGPCHVVPYGSHPVPAAEPEAVPPEPFRVLFVGRDPWRKGLHRLLLAWKAARLPEGSRLTLVTIPDLPPALKDLVASAPNVFVRSAIARRELAALYRGSHLFVMPSILEGFGHVYVEALMHGCPVLGTAESVLPDLGGPEEGIYLASGEVPEIVAQLESLAQALPGHPNVRRQAATNAAQFTFDRFHRELPRVLRGELGDQGIRGFRLTEVA